MESVVRVIPRQDYHLEIEFNTGEVRLFDVRPYLDKGVFSQLKDRALFTRAFVAFDTVCWPNELDIAPETLYLQSVPLPTTVHEKSETYEDAPNFTCTTQLTFEESMQKIKKSLSECEADTKKFIGVGAANHLANWRNHSDIDLINFIKRTIRIKNNQANGFIIHANNGTSLEKIVIDYNLSLFDKEDIKIAKQTLGIK